VAFCPGFVYNYEFILGSAYFGIKKLKWLVFMVQQIRDKKKFYCFRKDVKYYNKSSTSCENKWNVYNKLTTNQSSGV